MSAAAMKDTDRYTEKYSYTLVATIYPFFGMEYERDQRKNKSVFVQINDESLVKICYHL